MERHERETHRAWLTEWRAPDEMYEYVDRLMGEVGLGRAGCEFLRDAWAASTFASLRGAPAVRLVSDLWPDFEVRTGAGLERFEFVQADIEGRRMDVEHREARAKKFAGKSTLEHDPVEAWIARAEQVPACLARAVASKIGKNYAQKTSLLVYLNINEYGIRQREIEGSFATSTAEARDKFKNVWVLWKARAYEVWRDGRRV
jgi:hypothetical protein